MAAPPTTTSDLRRPRGSHERERTRSGEFALPAPFGFVLVLRRTNRRTAREEMIHDCVRLFVVENPGRTLRLNRAREVRARESANELTTDAERVRDFLRAGSRARTERHDCGRFDRLRLRHFFTPLRECEIERTNATLRRIEHERERVCANARVGGIRLRVHGMKCSTRTNAYATLREALHNVYIRAFVRSRSMRYNSYEHTFAPPAAPPRGFSKDFPRAVRAERAKR